MRFSLQIRKRLERAFGTGGNHLHVTFDRSKEGPVTDVAVLDVADRWLTAVMADTSDQTRAQKVLKARPADAQDGCILPDGTRVTEAMTEDPNSRCNSTYPWNADPRLVAGAPIVEDVLKCTLKPPVLADYAPQTLSGEQLERLHRVFPQGVCDYSKPSVGQQSILGTWLKYSTPGAPVPLQ